MNKRRDYIKHNYSLRETAGGWIAKSPYGEISSRNRCETIRRARRNWGHFNFEDEAEAFGKIFPPNCGYRGR